MKAQLKILLFLIFVCKGYLIAQNIPEFTLSISQPEHAKYEVSKENSFGLNELVLLDTIVTVTNTDDYSFKWFTKEEGNYLPIQNTFEVKSNATVFFEMTYNQVCYYFDSANLKLSSILSLGDIISDSNDLTIYPNPSKGHFSIGFNVNLRDVEIVVSNNQGKLISNKSVKTIQKGFIHLIDLSEYSSGVYLLFVSSNDKSYYQPILLAK